MTTMSFRHGRLHLFHFIHFILFILFILPISSSSTFSSSSSFNFNPSNSYLILIDKYNHQNSNSAQIITIPNEKELSKFILSYTTSSSSSSSSSKNKNKHPIRYRSTIITILLYWTLYQTILNPNSMYTYEHLLWMYLIYLLEVFVGSSTKKYLHHSTTSNAISNMLHQWKYQIKPDIIWTLQCFRKQDDTTKKIITHQAQTYFQYSNWTYAFTIPTMASIQTSTNIYQQILPFQKIKFINMIIIKGNALNQYLQQKSFWESMEGGKDTFTEVFTSVHVSGFQSHVLLDRRNHPTKSYLIAFWCFTILGLTLPYRIWFQSKCDDTLYTTIVKEIF